MKKCSAIDELLAVVAKLRAPDGCPWDRQQDHRSLRYHAVEEVYELLDAIEAGDDRAMEEELGDLLLHVALHCQLASERGAFDFARVARRLTSKLIYRHPHVFGAGKIKSAAGVLAQWDKLKQAEKRGASHQPRSAFDGIPRRLPALLRVEKLLKKARRAGLLAPALQTARRKALSKRALAQALFALAARAQAQGWSAEALLRAEARRHERAWRRKERRSSPATPPA